MPSPWDAVRSHASSDNIPMNKFLVATLLLTAAISSDVYGLDLTPHEIVLSNDGPPVKRYFFQNEGKRLSFRIDNKMTLNGTSDSVVFRFQDMNTASMKLSKSPLQSALPFDEKNLAAYRAAARAVLPADATNIQSEEEKPDAIAINDWTSHQFIFTYNLFGFAYRRAITFLNFNAQEQIVFDVSAAAADYEKTYARGYRVLNSLAELSAINKSGPT